MISASGGHPRAVVWVATLQRGGGASRWCTILVITNLHYQRAQPSPLWSRLFLETRIGRGLARIPRVLYGQAQCGAGPVRPHLARRVGGAAREGEMVEGATPCFLALVRHRAGGGGAPVNSHHLPSPSGVAPSAVIPGGKAIERPFALTVDECPPV